MINHPMNDADSNCLRVRTEGRGKGAAREEVRNELLAEIAIA